MASKDKLWNSGHDESVEVNQRALIDKVLARYSGEFTVFRELLQNSDDAQSKAVEIRFQTEDYDSVDTSSPEEDAVQLPNLKTTPVHRWIFRNNGVLFRDEDWNRLKKIAEGNPDEQKIGAFGVGFYSLFSVTEEPFVTSGDQWMGFYWKDKKDQLFARRGKLDEPSQTPWTAFEMVLREPAPVPPAFDFTRFLASSITFMTYLEEVSVYFNNWCLCKLTKSSGLPQQQDIPRTITLTTPNKFMTVNSVHILPVSIKASVMNWVYTSGTEAPKRPPPPPKPSKSSGGGFFSSLFASFSVAPSSTTRPSTPLPSTSIPVNPRVISETSITLSIFSADVNVRLSNKLSAEIYRSTKKNPPPRMKYELIYTAKDIYDASREEDKRQSLATGSVFQGLRADLEGTGSTRVFIGHATAQTTGIGGHMAARFIPTVEREAIDFMDRNVAVWNRELLFIGGILARVAYQLELAHVKERWDINTEVVANKHIPEELRSSLINHAIHTLKFFTFHQSTPSAEVSNALEEAFFRCDPHNLSLISTLGVRSSSQIRLPDSSFSFLRNTPVVPDELISDQMTIVLQNRGMIKPITFDDVLAELRSRPLPENDMVACLKWWNSVYDPADVARLTPIRTQLLEAAVLIIPKSGLDEEKVIPLHTIKTVLNQRLLNGLPLEGPLPPHLLPPSISKQIPIEHLKRSLPWTDLTLSAWIDYICDPQVRRTYPKYDIESSPHWAEKVLSFVARAWNNETSSENKAQALGSLKALSCIPTSDGMKRPDESYFSSVDIFHDLPIVKLPSGSPVKGQLEKVLQLLDVRKHVELQIIFNRMVKTNEWTINDLARYLASVKTSLKDEEIRRLKLTSAFPREQADVAENSKPQRYRADQLYEPLPVFRQLGLPVIDWGKQTKWRSSSEEAQFLFNIGLRRHPPLSELIQLCTSANSEIRLLAFTYFVDNIQTKYSEYDPKDYQNVAFIPALGGQSMCLGSPQQVFVKPEWSYLGFLTLRPDLKSHAVKLKIKDHPTTGQLIQLIQTKQPRDEEEARKWFSTLSVRVSEFSRTELSRLSETQMVPVRTPPGVPGPTMRWLKPTQCYLGQNSEEYFHSKLFVYVNFDTAGNAFLTACGAKHEPSVEEVAKILLEDPHRFYDLAQGPTNFLNELRNIAVNRKSLSAATQARMKKAPVLLCYQRKVLKASSPNHQDELEEEDIEVLYDLKKAEEIIIADDTNAHQSFGAELFTAPQEDMVEAFYIELGSRRLSSLVKESYILGSEIPNSKRALGIRALILERLPIFLHEHTHARTKVSLEWLHGDSNLQVRVYGQIRVKKTLTYGKLNLQREQEASAVARRGPAQRIELLLAENAEIDMYEVAICVNRCIFESPKAHDALLFMTILSTDLRALKRRGYNVDRILRQRRLEKQAREAREREERIRLLSQGTAEREISDHQQPPMVPDKGQLSMRDKIDNIKKHINPFNPQGNPHNRGSPAFFDIKSQSRDSPSQQDTPAEPLPGNRSGSGGLLGTIFQRQKRMDSPTVTPLDNITANINMAIKACRPEASNLLHNRQEMRLVKEINDDGYCDVTGHAEKMRSIGVIENVKIFASQDVPEEEAKTFIALKTDVVTRFVHIMTVLARVYNLDLINLHIFYDTKGVLIAFNRNGSIFLNLRYYEAWHDSDVLQGRQENALISWYFTLAHEVAHNLVQPHNSEHEFYFSAICEKYLVALAKVILERSKSEIGI